MDAKDAVSFRSRVGYICNKVDSIVYVHSFRFVWNLATESWISMGMIKYCDS